VNGEGSACLLLQVASGSVQKAVIVEVKKGINRADGSKLRFDRNACVLVSDKGDASANKWSVESCCSAVTFGRA
jgi:ribosomal protein L14